MPSPIPAAVRKFASEIAHPVALIGCRASEVSLGCCEYDLVVFASGDNKVVHVDGSAVELVHFAGPVKNLIADLGGMTVLNDAKFVLSSAAMDIRPEKYRRALAAAGKKSMISSLFCQQRMVSASKHPPVAAMWLKIAAYEFVGGAIALSGSRPMPLHELGQLRQAVTGSIAEGVEVALECIGIERATRPAISRSIKAIKELKSKDYDRDLFASKVDHLLGKSMLSDCYYYAGRVAAKSLAGKKEPFYSQYAKLVQLALDLSSDTQHIEKLQKKLFRAANGGLKG